MFLSTGGNSMSLSSIPDQGRASLSWEETFASAIWTKTKTSASTSAWHPTPSALSSAEKPACTLPVSVAGCPAWPSLSGFSHILTRGNLAEGLAGSQWKVWVLLTACTCEWEPLSALWLALHHSTLAPLCHTVTGDGQRLPGWIGPFSSLCKIQWHQEWGLLSA